MMESDVAAPVARDAATVMVIRGEGATFEVFMVRRHHQSGFMANAYVYPGGKLDAEDCVDAAQSHVIGLTARQARDRLGDVDSPTRALGLFLAGLRETFEEAGILLACRRGESEYIDLTSSPEVAARFAAYRVALQKGELSFCALANKEDLKFNLEGVGYFAHWITPYFESRRFDTRFFVVVAPANQRPLHDAVETTQSLWVRPTEALDGYRRGELFIAPPTLRTLEQLGDFDSPQSLLEFASTHRPPAILPHLAEVDDAPALLLPGDEAFPAEDPLYERATSVSDGVTRMVLRDGRWESILSSNS